MLLGIVGGMGPAATIRFQQLLLLNARASTDQEHLPYLLCMNPHIPSRQSKDYSFHDMLLQSISKLEIAGATHVVVICYSAHIGINTVLKGTAVQLIDVTSLTTDWIVKNVSEKEIGLLAAPAVMDSRLYANPLMAHGYHVHCPSQFAQKSLVEAAIYDPIFGIKAGNYQDSRRLIDEAISGIVADGAKKILLGCSDLSVVFLSEDCLIIDPLKICAEYVTRLHTRSSTSHFNN